MGTAERVTDSSGGKSPDGPNSHGNDLEPTTYDGVSFVAPTWEQMGDFTRDLARKINDSGASFDLVIPLAKGGLTWSRILVDRIGVDTIIPIRIQRYTGINTAGKPKVLLPLPDRIDGKRVLLFDEVIDEGATIISGRDHAIMMGASDVKIATLCYKPHARDLTGAVADYSAFETDAWVAFPHEVRGFIEEQALKWLAARHSMEEVKERLIKIGMKHEDVEHYVNPLQKLYIQTNFWGEVKEKGEFTVIG